MRARAAPPRRGRRCGLAAAIAWVLAQRPWIVPLVGARTVGQIEDALGAVDLHLSPDALSRIEAAMPRGAALGTRYGLDQMRILDSERA